MTLFHFHDLNKAQDSRTSLISLVELHKRSMSSHESGFAAQLNNGVRWMLSSLSSITSVVCEALVELVVVIFVVVVVGYHRLDFSNFLKANFLIPKHAFLHLY